MSSTQTTFRFNPIRVLMSLPSDCAILTDIDWTPLNEATALAATARRNGGEERGASQRQPNHAHAMTSLAMYNK